jgi:hypothetical protein
MTNLHDAIIELEFKCDQKVNSMLLPIVQARQVEELIDKIVLSARGRKSQRTDGLLLDSPKPVASRVLE